jgi:predicted nucleic acid-binding protein
MEKLKLYLDTSVWNFIFADETPEKQKATEDFFEQVRQGDFIIYISEIVVAEIEKTQDKSSKDKLLQLLKTIPPQVLSRTAGIEDIALEIMELAKIPQRYANDALHIAWAINYEMDVLVSWNMSHIVRFQTKKAVSALCRLRGFKEIELLTPEEVMRYED